MPVLEIADVGEPVLREQARELSVQELESPEIQRFIDDLVETMHHAKGAGLAANQVFRPVQVCAIEVKNNPRYPYKPNIPLTILINPVLTPVADETFQNFEGCLSVPGLRGVVPRWASIRVQALDRHGSTIDHVVKGITAGTYQHEVDHLEGKLFLDRVEDTHTLCTWETFRRHYEGEFRERVKSIVERFGS